MKKLFTLFLLGLFMISFASAFTISSPSTWDDKVEFQDDGAYGNYKIADTFLWIFNKKQIKTVKLIENGYSPFTAWNIKEIEIFQPTKLFDKTEYFGIDKKTDKSKYIESEEQLYREWVEFEKEIETTTDCKTYKTIINNSNTTEVCYEWNKVIEKIKIGEWSEWKDYKWKSVQPGLYQTKTIITRSSTETGAIDWVDTNDGHKLKEWAVWWNDSWEHYKEYTNLTGNITYMEINKTENDNVGFTDTRFVSCIDETLVFNHTLEATIGTKGQFRVNNQGENCTLRYYGNSDATSTSSASDVYFNPVSAYYFDANANDFVGSNHGTITDATLSSGHINGSYNFPGASDYIDLIGVTTGTSSSISTWVYVNAFGTGGSGQKDYLIDIQTGRTLISLNNVGQLSYYNGGFIDFGTKFSSGAWHHVVLTLDATNTAAKMYVDGSQFGATKAYSPVSIGGTITLGSQYATKTSDNLNAKIDEVLIYDDVLTPTQVYQLYTQTAPTIIEGPEEDANAAPSISDLVWITTGGFTDSTLVYGQALDMINVTANDTDGNLADVYITVTDPDSVAVVDNVSMSNSTATAWYYGTDVTLNKAGIWNINTTAIDSSGAINSTASNITVSIESQSTKDGWYGYANESYLTSSEIITLAGYGYDIFEFEENMTEQQASFSDLKTSINDSRESNIKSGINIILDFDYNSSALKLQYLTDITEDFGDLISIPYSDSVAYISFELENMGGYTNATLDALINEFAQNMTSITDNDFVIYSKNYNTTGLDSSYIQPTLMIYLNPADEETFINDQLSTFKQSTSLNRMYTQIPTAIKVLASEFQSSIIDNLRSVPDPGTLTQSNATSLANEDVIIFNNNSATTNYTINVSELSVTGKDVWDSTSGWLIEMNTTDVFTVSVPGYSAATIFFEYLDHIEMSSLTSGTVYKADSPSAANANYTDGQQDGNWMVSTDSDLQIELFDQHYTHSEFITYYGWLNVSFLSQPTGWEEYEVAIIADKNNAELDALNYTATEFYGYISVSDYNNTQSWNDAKAAEVDYWLSLNESMNIFVDGLDYAIVTANFSTRMKQLIDYIQITKTRKAILNTYTAYTDFATWGNGGVMKESCVNRWNGANPSAPISYTRENWTLELERSVWYTSHDIPVFCQAFDNRTNDGTYTIVNYTELQNIYFASKVLGYDNFWLSQPDFQYAHDEYVYDVGAKLGRNAQQLAADPNVYYRAYENGIVYYNITSEQGWIDDGLIVNSIETCFYLYNNQVGNVWNFNINDRDSTGDVGEYSLVQDSTFTWEWKCVDTSDEEPINGRYLVEAWVGDHTVSPGYNIAYSVVAGEGGHSWSDTSATDSYVAYPNGQNWMVSVESNFTIRVSIDTTPNILQVISEISRPVIGVEFTNISINSSRAFPIEVWSNPITTSINEFQNVSFYNSTGDWVALNYANNSDCDTDSPTWATTLIEGETFKACVEPSGADTLVRVGAPSLSTRLFQVSSPTTEPFIEFLTPPTPTEAEFIIDASINLTVNLTEEYFLNLTFDINGNKTTYTDATRSYIQTLSDGHYSVNATVSTTTGYSNTTEQRTFTLDTTYPVVSLISPANGSEYNSSWSNIEINFSSSDANLDACWYNTGGANSTITCNTNISYLVQEGAVNFIYYVNDTAGHLASANLTISGGDFVVDISNSTTNIVVSNGTSYWEENASLTFNSSAPSTSWFDWLVDGASKLTGWGENVFNWVFNLTADSPSATVTLDNGKYCYQESANTSNQTGIDGDCDLNYGGTWIYNIGLDEEINDGDNSTYGEIGTAYVTYNITENVTGATWKVIDYTGAHNLTVPQDSLISGELEFKINSGATFGGTSLYWVYWYVKDSSSSWVLLQSASSSTVGEYTRVFEEAVEWEMGNIATEEFLIVTNSEAPVFNLVNVTTASIYELGENVSIDFNVSDPNLDSCWYGYHSANTSFACTSGVEKEVNVTSTAGTASITFYANDTLGNMNSTSVNYTVDSIAPIVNATSPNETFGYTVFGGNETLNWTVTDANLDSCWYAYPRMEENISDSDFDSDTYWNFKNGTMTNTSGENVLSSVILVPTDIVALKVNLATNGLSISNFDSSVPDCNTVHYNEYSPLVNNGWYACVKDTANRTYVIEQISSDNFTSYDYTTDINCSGITEEFVPVAGQNSITVYANDTIGNIGNSTTSWSYVILETSQTFSNTTVETNAESFSINVTYSSSLWNSITTSLFYDGTEYAGITTGTGDDIVISRSIYIPGVTNATNKTFYWEIQLSNITGTYSYYSNNQTQLVNVVGFEICDYADDPQIFFKTFSTTEPTTSVNATFKSAWTIRNADGGEAVLSRSFQDLSETNSTFGFCIDPNSTTYTLSIDVEVDASAYTRTYHYIVDTDYTAVTQNVSLYLLNDSYSTLTKLIVKDIDSSPVEDVYVTIQRYDIGTDTYYNVGQARTDSDGSDLAYLQWYDYWYKFIGVKDGEVVFTNGPKKVSESPLNFITGTTSGDDNVTSEITGFLDWRDITYDLSFSDSGNNFVLTFVDTTGLAQESCLKTIKRNVTNDYLICDSCVTSASGTLYCNIDGYGNGTFIAEYYINTPTYIFIDNLYEYVNNDVPIFDLIGNDNGTGLAILTAGIVLAFFLISPALGIVGMIIGMVIVVALGFQPFEIVSFMGMIVVGVLLMWAVKK